MRGWTKVLLVIVLIALPVAARWLWFNRGWYMPPVIPEIDDSEVEVPLPEYRPSAGEMAENVGRVVFDVAHANNLEVDDLTPLRDRLSTRGVAVETFDGWSSSLESRLRGAIALVVVAPTWQYTAEEREIIVDFVEDGGRLLLAADPTRPVLPEEEEDSLDLSSVLFPTSAVPAINSLADAFGIVYFDDYLYNLVDSEGNYRNVKLTVLSDEHPLTEGLQKVIFFAAHSLRTEGLSLMSGDENTLSPLRTGETDLTAAALSADERVMALGDVTVLTAPYHTIADNDRFLSNIADWLAAAERLWHLKDFPYLFQGPVDLVQVAGDFLDSRLIAHAGDLETVFEQADLTLSVRATADPDHDTLFVGTFEHAESVGEYLDAAGVTITLVEEEEGATPTPTPQAGGEEEEPRETIEVELLGSITVEGTSLFVVDRSPDRIVLIVLAEDGEAVIQAMERLVSADFLGCVESDDVTVCSTGVTEEGLGLDVGPSEEPEGPPVEGETVGGPPTVGSLSESEAAFVAGTEWLEDLAAESYDVTSQPGETYIYTIAMDESQDVMWVYGWCAAMAEQLAENWENISLVFTLDDEEVPLSSFAMLESALEDQECRLYYVLLTDWPPGEHVLTTEVTFAAELDDGFDIYPAGTHVYEYLVTVGG